MMIMVIVSRVMTKDFLTIMIMSRLDIRLSALHE